MKIYLTEKQLKWLAEQFAAADIETKIDIDVEGEFETQLEEALTEEVA